MSTELLGSGVCDTSSWRGFACIETCLWERFYEWSSENEHTVSAGNVCQLAQIYMKKKSKVVQGESIDDFRFWPRDTKLGQPEINKHMRKEDNIHGTIGYHIQTTNEWEIQNNTVCAAIIFPDYDKEKQKKKETPIKTSWTL